MKQKTVFSNMSQKGLTLIELIIAIGITSVVLVAATGTVYQLLSGNSHNSNAMTATRNVQQAGHWISNDMLMADYVEISLPDQPPQENTTVDVFSIYWFDYDEFGLEYEEGGTYDTSFKYKVTYKLTITESGANPLIRYLYATTSSDEHINNIDYSAYNESWESSGAQLIANFIAFRNLTDFVIDPAISGSKYYKLTITSYVPGFRPGEETKFYEIRTRPD